MKLGDFTNLAKNYINRAAYSDEAIDILFSYVQKRSSQQVLNIADVGAGTGKLTKMLLQREAIVTAVEPNKEMLTEGSLYTKDYSNVSWQQGSAEINNLIDNKYDLITMGSSFHWTDPSKSLPCFASKLKSKGIFAIMWNPRNIEISPLHMELENIIYSELPNLKRVSSGGSKHTKDWSEILLTDGHFSKPVFIEAQHEEVMSRERYLGAWNSVNDIRAQAGEEKWAKIVSNISERIKSLDTINVPYKTRMWLVSKN